MVRARLAVVIGAAVVAMAACSSSGSTNDQSSTPNLTSAAQTTAAQSSASVAVTSTSAAPSSVPAALSALSGTWHGQYTGSYSGTFVLSWQQSGATLTGTIALSTAGATVPIHGMVSGSAINFGTVGSSAITYTGSVSGNSMSGNYQVAGAAGGSGTWTASKA
jgi:hypothetical protein